MNRILLLFLFTMQLTQTNAEVTSHECIVSGTGTYCFQAYNNARTTIDATCGNLSPLCVGSGEDPFYRWVNRSHYDLEQVIREDKLENLCTVELKYRKSCQREVHCKNPLNCPF